MIYTTTKISSLCPPSSQRMQHRLFCLRNVCMVIPPFEAKWCWWSFFWSSIITCSHNIAIHPCQPHPSINQSIHPSILLGRPDVARINPATIMHNCALLYKWSYYTKTKLVTASTYTKCRSNDQQQHFALGKKGWPRQWHHLSWGEELVEVSWESVEFLIARVVIKVPKLLHQQHAPVFLCHMYRES